MDFWYCYTCTFVLYMTKCFKMIVKLTVCHIIRGGGGRVVRWCWVNFQCRGILLIWIRVGPTTLAVGAGGCCLDIFSLFYHFSFFSPYLWETARYRLKYCLKGPLSPKQPTNQPNYSRPICRNNAVLKQQLHFSEVLLSLFCFYFSF